MKTLTTTEIKDIIAAGRVEMKEYNRVFVDGHEIRAESIARRFRRALGW